MIIFVTGGARSGKSRFAEKLSSEYNDKIYVATALSFDEEMAHRITKHRQQRGVHWKTIEGYSSLDEKLSTYADCPFILIDCITNMVTNLMLADITLDWDNVSMLKLEEIEQNVMAEIDKLLNFASNYNGKIVIVSNELGMGLVPEYPLGRYFRDIAGRANQIIAQASDEAYLLVSGIEIKIKG